MALSVFIPPGAHESNTVYAFGTYNVIIEISGFFLPSFSLLSQPAGLTYLFSRKVHTWVEDHRIPSELRSWPLRMITFPMRQLHHLPDVWLSPVNIGTAGLYSDNLFRAPVSYQWDSCLSAKYYHPQNWRLTCEYHFWIWLHLGNYRCRSLIHLLLCTSQDLH